MTGADTVGEASKDSPPGIVLLIDGLAVTPPRVVCQFSCGAASAVATKLALGLYGGRCVIVNAYVKQEHPDNRRFLADCERWFGQTVTVLRNEKYDASTVEVFKRHRFMASRFGAKCSMLLKRELMDAWKQPGDVMVFGYTAEEADRLEDFRDRYPDRPVLAPLVDAGLGKEDCKAMVQRVLAVLPESAPGLILRLAYGAGLRLSEGLRLRVKDVDLDSLTLTVRDGKGGKDRTTVLPAGGVETAGSAAHQVAHQDQPAQHDQRQHSHRGEQQAQGADHVQSRSFGCVTLQGGFFCCQLLNSSATLFSQVRTLCE